MITDLATLPHFAQSAGRLRASVEGGDFAVGRFVGAAVEFGANLPVGGRLGDDVRRMTGRWHALVHEKGIWFGPLAAGAWLQWLEVRRLIPPREVDPERFFAGGVEPPARFVQANPTANHELVVAGFKDLSLWDRGGMGTIYRGSCAETGRAIALKVFETEDPFSSIAFENNLLAAVVLAIDPSPSLASAQDFGFTPEGHPYLVMDFIPGKSLADLCCDLNEVTQKIVIGEKGLIALAHLHRRGLIHGDMKLEQLQIFQGGSGRWRVDVTLVDFDGVRPSPRDLERPRAIVASTVLPPEGIRRQHPVNKRFDIFATGWLLYELFTGRLPWGIEQWEVARTKSDASVVRRMESSRLVPPSRVKPDLPPSFDRVLLKALSLDPDARYQDANEMLFDYRQAVFEWLRSTQLKSAPV